MVDQFGRVIWRRDTYSSDTTTTEYLHGICRSLLSTPRRVHFQERDLSSELARLFFVRLIPPSGTFQLS
jgi:hypothetical protein